MNGSSEYISREAVLALAESEEYLTPDGDEIYHEYIPVSAVKRIPAADVRPVRSGKWERMLDNDVFGDIHCKCSACGEDWWQGPGWFRNARFCPNCGAWMEES